jgi:cell division septation protein DedD
MKSAGIIAIVVVAMIGVMVPNAFAETWYYYVEPLPEYASYANNVMELSTTAWEDANDNLQFIEVSSPQQANFQVQWVKEFGVEHVGYAFGSWFIEVGLGDSNCGSGMWQPYSEAYTTDIMTHEIGHVLGFDHVNDPNSIMYPTAINWEYGNVETRETLTTGYGFFQPICTSKDVTTFDWHVSSDDPTYGFDVYFVPSVNEFDNWVDGESFNYFVDNGCSAENMLSVGGTCKGVTQDSGLLIIMGDDASEPLTEITLNFQENNFESILDTSNSEKSLPDQNSNDGVLVDTTFALYVDPQQKFSIKYPSNWIIDSTDYGFQKANFLNEDNWKAQIYVTDYGEIDYTGLSSSEILDDIVSYEQEYCTNATFVDDGLICYDFQLVGTKSDILASGHKGYVVMFTSTIQYDGIIGVEYPTTTLLAEVHDGSNVWVVYAEVETDYVESFSDVLTQSVGSFKLIQSGEDSSTTNSIPIPIPTPQPDVITSTGTAALSKTSVNVSSGQSEQVKIYGIVSNVDKSTRVSITYTYPDGTTDGGTIFTTDTGVYETYLNLDKNSPIGNYEILVTAKGKILGTLILQVNDKTVESYPSVEIEPTPVTPTPVTPTPVTPTPVTPTPVTPTPVTPTPESTEIASFVDQTKDPREYLIRYYTEPKYQQWFDTNFPNDRIEDKVGYPYKIITDEYYVNSLFDFVIKKPANLNEIVNVAGTISEGENSLVAFEFGGNDEWWSNFNIHYQYQDTDNVYYDDLIDYYSTYPSDSNPYTQQLKINDQSVKQNSDGRYEVRYDFVTVESYPEDYFVDELRGTTDESKSSIVVFLYPNGDEYELILSSYEDSYSKDVQIFNESIDSFYVGETEKLSQMMMDYKLTLEPTIEVASEPTIEVASEPTIEVASEPNCGTGTKLVNGICEIIQTEEKSSKGGGCLIATATYGSEMATEVQQLRELRNNQLLNTESGTAFMGTFNDVYYSFSPIIADYERENPLFKEAVKLAITPMISTLSLMENAETESEVLGIGISVILLNLGMYLGVPAIVVIGIRKRF